MITAALSRVQVLRLQVSVWLICFCLASFASEAQQNVRRPQQPVPQNVHWTYGPAKVGYGTAAEIIVPQGFKLVDQNGGAKAFMDSQGNPCPPHLVGVLMPATGPNGIPEWYTLIEDAPIGYVSDADQNALGKPELLTLLRRNMIKLSGTTPMIDAASLAGMDWEFPPKYDSARNELEYAVRTGIPGAGSINCSIYLLGRHGVLTLVGVYPYQAGIDFAPLRDLAKGISFRDGYRYSDHKEGDEEAHIGLVQLATSEGILSPMQRLTVNLLESKAVWAVAGVVCLLGVAWMFWALAFRKPARRHIVKAEAINGASRPLQPVAASPEHQNGHAAVAANGLARRGLAAVNGKAANNGHRRRRKLANYHAFYSDMVMSLTRCNYGNERASEDSEYAEEPHEARSAGQRMGNNGMSNDDAHDTTKLLVMETAKLLESQQKLIEGQRKLIEEQSKLIREKSNLIEAETKVLEQQSELFAGQQLL
jgi:uncharacterized membrane-anchored protein